MRICTLFIKLSEISECMFVEFDVITMSDMMIINADGNVNYNLHLRLIKRSLWFI